MNAQRWFPRIPLATLSVIVGVLATSVAGCTNLGPRTVAMDRFDYSTAIGDSWKQQTLLNIVKLRHMDLPVFVDVASVVSGYSLQTGVNVGVTASSEKAVQGNFVAAGAQAVYTDRPTITYVPMTGEKFLHSLVTPIDPKNIFFMLQSGYAADFILALTVESINGVRNRSTTGGVVREADPDFVRVLELLRQVQSAGAVGMRVEQDKARGTTAVLFFRQDGDVPAEIAAQSAEIRRLLRVPENQQRFVLTYSPMRGAENELAVHSRSMLQILAAFAAYVETPEPDGSGVAAAPPPAGGESQRGRVRIHSGTSRPRDCFVAIDYRGRWFWIDNDDWQTKRALTAVMFFFTLAETSGGGQLPLITIPAQ